MRSSARRCASVAMSSPVSRRYGPASRRVFAASESTIACVETFTVGTVTVDFSGADRKAKINFNEVGEKTLLLGFAKLRILEN